MLQTAVSFGNSLLSGFAALFEPRHEHYTRRDWELPCLLALIVLAAVVRFWGLGSFSLHKPDEDTTVVPAVHILQDGTPRFPSGMYYARAIAQSYLIAASVKVFGPTEWAIRLPSALCGLLLVPLAYLLGRRFLSPLWNMVFTGIVALLPGLIADSQEARMYSFLLASLAVYTLLIFEWERTNRLSYLLGAVLAMLVALQFQLLAVFGVFIVLFPGLLRGDPVKLRQGMLAFVAIAVGYVAISHWDASFYPKASKVHASAALELAEAPAAFPLESAPLYLVAVIAGAGLLTLYFTRGLAKGWSRAVTGALLFLGLMCEALLAGHLAALLLLAAVVVARRVGKVDTLRLVVLVLACVALAALELGFLRAADIGSWRKAIGVLIGFPSVWPYLKLGSYSRAASVLTLLGMAAAMWRLASGKRVADHWLFFLLAVWVPIFMLGFFDWFIPARYAEFALLPLLICALAPWQSAAAGSAVVRRVSWGATALAVVLGAAVVDPFALARAVNAGDSFPDHRAAALYMRSVKPGPKDIVIAEEALLQTYYLGHVDYWLRCTEAAAPFVVSLNGRIVDEYTHAPVIESAEQLMALIRSPDRGAIYVIGSGEGQEDGRRYYRGEGISELLQSDQLKVVYTAHDGLTKVWKVDAPTPALAEADR